MIGIQYLVDNPGNRTAIVVDLSMHGELAEEVFDSYLIEHLRHE